MNEPLFLNQARREDYEIFSFALPSMRDYILAVPREVVLDLATLRIPSMNQNALEVYLLSLSMAEKVIAQKIKMTKEKIKELSDKTTV